MNKKWDYTERLKKIKTFNLRGLLLDQNEKVNKKWVFDTNFFI